MRKNIALILALVMILSLIPMTTFAATDNRVTSRPQVQEDDILYPATWGGAGDVVAPNLIILNDPGDLISGQQYIIELSLSNAEWMDAAETVANIVYFQTGSMNATQVNKLSDTILEVVFTAGAVDNNLIIPMWTEITADTGIATVTIDPLDSPVTGGTYTFATIAEGATSFVADDVIRMGERGTLDTLRIRELSVGAMGIGTQEITFELNRNFVWGAPVAVGVDLAAANFVSYSAGFVNPGAATVTEIDRGGSRMTVEFELGTARSARGTISLIDWPVLATRDARFGDVTVDMRGDNVTNQRITVAEYVDFGLRVRVDGEPEEIVAGLLPDLEPNEGELATLIIEETIAGSWFANRRVTVELPSWVQIVSYDVTENAHIDSGLTDTLVLAGEWDNVLEFTPSRVGTGRAKLEIDFVVTARANAEGPITATVTSRAFDQDYEVVLGNVIAPVTVDVEMTEVVSGIQNQMLNDIVITENLAGALIEGEDLVLNLNMDWSRWQSGIDVEVVEGDLELGTPSINGNRMTIPVDRESDEASVIVISNVRLTLDRVPAFGEYNLRVGGSALVNNSDPDSDVAPFDSPWVVNVPVITVVDTATIPATEIAFTIGQMAYMVDGEMTMMDVAPFISEGRIMVPVRYLEELFGMQPIWNPVARTVTVLYNGMVFEMTIGSTMLRVNGAPFMEMDAAATIVDSRTFVPASRFARAMGIDYTWDPVTQTATFMR